MLSVLALFICCTDKNASAQPAGFASVSTAVQKPMSSSRQAGGIKVVRLTHAVGGMKLDLRYKVIDYDKVSHVFNNKTPLVMIDQATGTKLKVPNMPKVGSLRQVPHQNEPWRIYWMMFDNPGMLVKKGGKVTLLIGDVMIKDITVE